MDNKAIVFVSLGPGEAELITLKGFHALQQADIILCPGTKTNKGNIISRAANILHQLGIDDNKMKLFPVPMEKDRKQAMMVYDDIYNDAIEHYSRASYVAIVAEGDAGFYSSIHYVYDRLHLSGIPVRTIPGIPAFIACGAIAGLHIVQQEERLVVIPGNATASELSELLNSALTVVIMKLSQCIDELHRFIKEQPSYYYHYFENAGTEKEYYSSDRNELQNKTYPYFSLMIIQKCNQSFKSE